MDDCSKCSFRGSEPEIGDFNKEPTNIMVISGQPLDERHKIYLNKLLSSKNIDNYFLTSAVKCFKKNHKTGEYILPTIKVVGTCKGMLEQEFEIVEPKVVLLLGNIAIKAILGKISATSILGESVVIDEVKYIPSYAIEDVAKNKVLVSSFNKHLDYFKSVISNIGEVTTTNYTEIETEKEFIAFIEDVKEVGEFSVDIETSRVEPFFNDSEITSISFSVREGESKVCFLSFPCGKYIETHSSEHKFKLNSLLTLVYVKRLLTIDGITKIFHNAQFDVMWLEIMLDIKIHNYRCTMIMQAILHSEEVKGLKYLSKKHTDIENYEYDIKSYIGSDKEYLKIPPKKMVEYNGGDSDVTLRIYHILKKELLNNDIDNKCYNFILDRIDTLITLQRTGMSIDVDKCVELRDEYSKKIEVITDEVRSLPEVITFEKLVGRPFKPSSSKDCMALVYGGTLNTKQKIPKTTKFITATIEGYPGVEVELGKTPKVASKKTGLKEATPSLGSIPAKRLLKKIQPELEYRDMIDTFDLEGLPEINPVVKFLKRKFNIASYSSQLANHITPMIDKWYSCKDKMVHSTFNGCGTRTGRLSSSNLNLLNLSRSGFVKYGFTSRFGVDGVLIEGDYALLEIFMLCFLSNDKKMEDILKSGGDLHKRVASIAFNKPETEITKALRTEAKKISFGIIYGKSYRTLAKDLCISDEEARQILNNYFEEFPGVKKFINDSAIIGKRQGYIRTLNGRKRDIVYNFDDKSAGVRVAVNTQCQGSASEVCLEAMYQLTEILRDFAEAKLVNSIYDALIVDCHKSVVNEVMDIQKEVMESKLFDWVKFPLRIEQKYGYNLKEMKTWNGETLSL